MTGREAGRRGPFRPREIDEIARRAGDISLTIEDVILLVLRADPRPIEGIGRLTGGVVLALTEALGGESVEPAAFESGPDGPRSADVERALDRLSFSNCVEVSGGGGGGGKGPPAFVIAPRGRDRISAKWDALPAGTRRALSQTRAGLGAAEPAALKKGAYVHNRALLEGGTRPAAEPGGRGGRRAAEERPAPGQAEAAELQKHVDRGDRLLKEGRHDEAYAAYKLAAKLRAPDAGLHLRMALSMAKMELYKDALGHCRAAIGANPAGAAGYAAAGRCLNKLGRHAEALPYHQRAAKLDPGSAAAHQNASFSLFQLGRHEEALRHAESEARIRPRDPAAHARVAACLSRLGRHADAIPPGRKAIEAAPDRVDSYLPLLTALHGLGRHKEALEWCERASEADAMDPRPHFAMALSLHGLGRHEEALERCQKSVGLDPSNPDFHAAASSLLRGLGRLSDALPHSEAVVSARPDSVPALLNLGGMLAEMGRHKDALVHFGRALRIDPRQPAPRYNRALSLQKTGRPRKALREYKKVIKLDPGSAGAHNNTGTVLAELGRNGEALAHFDRALELDPRNTTVHCNKALSLESLSLHREALAHFDRALELDPGSAGARIERASCLVELGLPDERIGRYAGEVLGPAAAAAGGASPGTTGRHGGAPRRAGRRAAPAQRDAPGGDRARRVKSLLSRDESTTLEFKSWPGLRPDRPSEPGRMAETIARELCGLANTEGGDLLIGVGDGGEVEGLAPGGARLLSRKERDEMLAWAANVVVDYFGAGHDGRFDREIVEVDGLDILHCAVAASKDGPVTLKRRLGGKDDFFVRAGSTCRALGSKEMLEYARKKWREPRPQPMGQSAAGLSGPGLRAGGPA